jgi:cysteine desulfurase
VDVAALEQALREAPSGPSSPSPAVGLVAVQSANGEVGTRQPVAQVVTACRAAGVPLLVDAAASIGHDRVDDGWDLLTADPRSWGSVPGAGVLVVRTGVRWSAPGPERDAVERGTSEPSLPAAFAAAVSLQVALAAREAAARRRHELVDRVRTAAARIPDTEVAGDPQDRLPHVLTFSCLYVDGEVIVGELDRRGFAVGSGSACTASTLEPSHVLTAMGVLSHGNVRIGLAHDVDERDVDRFCAELPDAVGRVRAQLGVDGL